MNRRVLMIIAAALLAVVGTGAVYAYVKNADKRALAGQQAVTVLIVAKNIPAGTTAAQVRAGGYVRTDHLPVDATPDGSVQRIDPSWDTDVATADIRSGQVVLRSMFGNRPPTTSGLTIPSGKLAVAVKLNVDGDVAGFVQPGSQIAVFDTFVLIDGKNVPSGSTNNSDKNDNWATKLLLPRVDVLAVSAPSPSGTKTGLADANNNPNNTALLVTVAVDQTDAERLIHVAQTGKPYAALLSDSSVTAQAPGVDNHNQLGTVFAGGIKP